ncbi:MAG: FeoA family protein [Candidatus Omnitrophica bacterium]|nr:FeoA family protein [Candidatus Omnitrophota bacterium]MDD5512729.1 FeoA family protein [Candidatus Omnitrophota bacterium]
MKKTCLAKMKAGQKGRVTEFSGGAVVKERLMSMGIYPGREITKLSHFALRGPVTIKVGRSIVAIGHGMAGKILLETE